ncbi:uncharacterized protein PG998_014911 [Apiospora kogelbergensis]|uniref:uncharacterized protein n=1 Tax=Apiospora kogelbergensis TaxID=1337665 RepID=UPI003131CB22
MKCLKAKNVQYVTISHVWDAEIGDVQSSRTPRDGIVERIFESAHSIFKGLEDSGHGGAEIWYDYLSVPQWHTELKRKILIAIPDFYRSSSFTLVLLLDVSKEDVAKLHSGEPGQHRIDSCIAICNAKYFRRVWTTMEYVRSADLKVMLKGYQIATEGDHHVFLPKLLSVWDEEVQRQGGNTWQVEQGAGMGQKIVPWQIGTLDKIRERVLVNFGAALATLRSRGCRSSDDFLHALRGIIKASGLEKLDGDPEKALVQIADGCLKEGDYSPLLVTPRISGYDRRQQQSDFGYFDVYSFGLGVDADGSCPTFHKDSVFNPGVSILNLEKIGTIDFAHTRTHEWELPPFPIFECYTDWVLHHSGPDVDEFVRAIGARFYNLSDGEVEAALSTPDRREIIEEELQARYNMPGSHWKGSLHKWRDSWNDTIPDTNRLVKALGLLSAAPMGFTALDFSVRHGGTMHFSGYEGFIAAACPVCLKTFTYRVAMFKRPTEMLGAVAYRIPGLRYIWTRVDGAGIIVKDRKVIGRLIYASPACICRPKEMVEVTIGNLPLFCSD